MNRLKEYRKAKGLTQAQLAKELQALVPGMDASLISKIENGLALPNDAVTNFVENVLASQSEAGEAQRTANVSMIIEETLKNDSEASVILRRIMAASRELPATRAELAIISKLPDREVRETIARLRNAGMRIASTSGSKGYWMCQDAADYAALRGEYMRRIASISKTVKAMDAVLPGQIEMSPDLWQAGAGPK